ncbi:MAG: ATP-binding cassette domain-containing protein [Candidatus Limnocylindrales bacterium]
MSAVNLDAQWSPSPQLREDIAENRVDIAVRFAHVTVLRAGTRVLDDVTFEIPRGSTVALLGPSGAGKTTAIEVGLAIRHIDSGAVRLLGLMPGVAVASGRVGAMLPSSGLPSGVRVGELLRFVRVLHDAPLRVDDLIDRAGLESLLDRWTDRLSDSEAQQLRFALALAGDPDLLLLDEPGAGLDSRARDALRRNMQRLKEEGRTVLLATRSGEDAAPIADRVLLLERGRLIGEGDVNAMRSRLAAYEPVMGGDAPVLLSAPAHAPGQP